MKDKSIDFAPRALIFDMDGLMIDSEPLWFEVERAFASRRGGVWTEALAQLCVGRGMEFTLRAMQSAFGGEFDLEEASEEIVELFISRVGELELKLGCHELLTSVRGQLPLAVASSSSMRLIHSVLARFEISSWFEVIVSGEQVERPKPAPDIFLRAASLLGVAPPDCVVLEDSLAGVTAGHAAGMRVIAIPEGQSSGRGFESLADAVVQDLLAAGRLLGAPRILGMPGVSSHR